MTEVQVDACSWSPYTGDSAQVAAKRKELQAAKMKQGEVVFYRFGDVSGIFQFYPARDGWNVQVDRCDDGVTGLGQNYIWDRYPGEVDPETPAHTLSVGLSGEPTGVGHKPMITVTLPLKCPKNSRWTKVYSYGSLGLDWTFAPYTIPQLISKFNSWLAGGVAPEPDGWIYFSFTGTSGLGFYRLGLAPPGTPAENWTLEVCLSTVSAAPVLQVPPSGHLPFGEPEQRLPQKFSHPGVGAVPTGVGTCVACGKPATAIGPTGLGGCCGQTSMEPSESGHHPYCEWEWGTCTCDQFLWDPSTALDDPGCVYREPNYGSDQIHLLKGVGPLGPANAADLRDTARAMAGLGQTPPIDPPASTTNPDGSVTIGDVTYPPPSSGPSTPGWTPPVQLPPASQTQPGTIPPGLTPSWTAATTTSTPAVAPFVAPAAPTPTNTGLLVAGIVVVAAGLGGIAYLAHARTVAGS